MTERQEFLLKMYDQLFNDINRHIMVVWQSVGVLVGAFAIFALVEKNVLSLDIAASIVLLLCSWLLAHLLDSSYWYNRNLVMIANIERQFLHQSDLKEIHCYFGKHRADNNMIEHLRLQLALGLGLGLIVCIYHFVDRVVPGFSAPISNFEFLRSLPYLLIAVSTIYIFNLKVKLVKKYNTFISNSPGKEIDSSKMDYSAGHGQ